MDSPELTTEHLRVLMAIAASGSTGTGAETVAARTALDKSAVLGDIRLLWDRGLVEQVEGIRAAYRVTEAGQEALA